MKLSEAKKVAHGVIAVSHGYTVESGSRLQNVISFHNPAFYIKITMSPLKKSEI